MKKHVSILTLCLVMLVLIGVEGNVIFAQLFDEQPSVEQETLTLQQGDVFEMVTIHELENPTYSWILTQAGQFQQASRNPSFRARLLETGSYELVAAVSDAEAGLSVQRVFYLNVKAEPTSGQSNDTIQEVPDVTTGEEAPIVDLQANIFSREESQDTVVGPVPWFFDDIDSAPNLRDNDDASVTSSDGTKDDSDEEDYGEQLHAAAEDVVLELQSLTDFLKFVPPLDTKGRIALPKGSQVLQLTPIPNTVSQLAIDLFPGKDTSEDGEPKNDNDTFNTFFAEGTEPLHIWFIPPTTTELTVIAVHANGVEGFNLPVYDNEVYSEIQKQEEAEKAARGNPDIAISPFKEQFIQFTVENLPEKQNPLLLYHWHFGDGLQSIVDSPIHQYKQPGEYTVRVAIQDITSGEVLYNVEQTFDTSAYVEAGAEDGNSETDGSEQDSDGNNNQTDDNQNGQNTDTDGNKDEQDSNADGSQGNQNTNTNDDTESTGEGENTGSDDESGTTSGNQNGQDGNTSNNNADSNTDPQNDTQNGTNDTSNNGNTSGNEGNDNTDNDDGSDSQGDTSTDASNTDAENASSSIRGETNTDTTDGDTSDESDGGSWWPSWLSFSWLTSGLGLIILIILGALLFLALIGYLLFAVLGKLRGKSIEEAIEKMEEKMAPTETTTVQTEVVETNTTTKTVAAPTAEVVQTEATVTEQTEVTTPPADSSAGFGFGEATEQSTTVVAPPASEADTHVPTWLQQGNEQAAAMGQTENSPPPPSLQDETPPATEEPVAVESTPAPAPVELPPETAAPAAPDWLSGTDSTETNETTAVAEQPPTPAAEPAADAATPDWLSGSSETTTSTETVETPVETVAPAPTETPAPAGNVPDWLSGAATGTAVAAATDTQSAPAETSAPTQAPVEPAPTATPVEATPAAADNSLPAWLQPQEADNATITETNTEVAAVPAEPAPIAALKTPVQVATSEPVTTTETVTETTETTAEPSTTPDWLQPQPGATGQTFGDDSSGATQASTGDDNAQGATGDDTTVVAAPIAEPRNETTTAEATPAVPDWLQPSDSVEAGVGEVSSVPETTAEAAPAVSTEATEVSAAASTPAWLSTEKPTVGENDKTEDQAPAPAPSPTETIAPSVEPQVVSNADTAAPAVPDWLQPATPDSAVVADQTPPPVAEAPADQPIAFVKAEDIDTPPAPEQGQVAA